jgi:hypothetical protein
VVTEWFHEHENDLNHLPWPSQSEWCRIPPIEFQTRVESMPRYIESVLARGGPTPF